LVFVTNLTVMTQSQQLRRLFVVGFIALSLGVLDSIIKGTGTGLFGALSETAAPWFVLAFVAGAATSDHRFALSAFAGFESTILALVGFYFVNSLIFSFGATTWLGSFYLALLSGKSYFGLALVSGPFFGACGAWWRRNHSTVPVIALGLLFVVEAVVRATQASIFAHYADPVVAIEMLVGVLWMVLAIRTTKALRRRANYQQAHRTSQLSHLASFVRQRVR
jgi:hypothetical protein